MHHYGIIVPSTYLKEINKILSTWVHQKAYNKFVDNFNQNIANFKQTIKKKPLETHLIDSRWWWLWYSSYITHDNAHLPDMRLFFGIHENKWLIYIHKIIDDHNYSKVLKYMEMIIKPMLSSIEQWNFESASLPHCLPKY